MDLPGRNEEYSKAITNIVNFQLLGISIGVSKDGNNKEQKGNNANILSTGV